jgi:2,5-dihydroxypyridine 5,6-dioxygenase
LSVITATAFKTAELVPMFRNMFELCKLNPTESLVLVTEPDSNQEYAAAMYGAARGIGADVLTLMMPSPKPEQVPVMRSGNVSSTILTGSKLAVDTLKRADMVIDLSSGGLLHSKEQREILGAGTRILMVHDPVECLQRLFPTLEDKSRVERGMERLKKGRKIHLESDSGSNVTFDMTDRPVIGQWGFTDEPGRWDHWPGAFQYTIPTEGMGDGTLVMDVGDIWYPVKRFITTPVKMKFENGAVVAIEGGFDALMIRDYIEGWKDPEGFAISHLGWGSHPNALWNSIAFQNPLDIIGQDGRTMYGNTLLALGENATFGGKHTTGCHQDFALRRHRFFLNDELIADSGRILPPDLK